MKTKVGIDDIATYVPKIYLDSEEMAISRGLEPAYITKGLGIEKLSIPDAHEDASTMAAMAALMLIEKNNLKPKDIDFIQVATESGPDASKPISCYVQGMLEQKYGRGSFNHIGAPETKFACVGATYAMIDRLSYISSGWNRSKYSIVIATDIAKYKLNSAGEPTQGAAAIALLLGKDPRLAVYEPEFTGFGTVDDHDFFRPLGSETAVVDGKYSIGCYLRDMRIAVESYKKNMYKYKKIQSLKESIIKHIDLASFHSPFPKMVLYAFADFLIHDWRYTSRWVSISKKVGVEPSRKGLEDLQYYISKDHRNFRKAFMKTEDFTSEFEKKVADSLAALKLIGNSYTASVWLGMASCFEMKKSCHEGQRFGIGSYGSGSSAIACSFIIQPDYKEVSEKISLMKNLQKRKKINMQTYEDLHEHKLSLRESIIPCKKEFALEKIGSEESNQGYRYYKYMA
jgi:hydroxymethylglutaryl-CoA synthase